MVEVTLRRHPDQARGTEGYSLKRPPCVQPKHQDRLVGPTNHINEFTKFKFFFNRIDFLSSATNNHIYLGTDAQKKQTSGKAISERL